MIKENLISVKESIRQITQKSGRPADDVRLVAVSKRFPIDAIKEAFSGGQILFGENYIQESQEKITNLDLGLQFHFIGQLQTNKAKVAASLFSMIETVDRLKLAKALNRHLEDSGKKLDILIQVNIGFDPNKSGIYPEETEVLLGEIRALKNLQPRGLMTMPPITKTAEEARPYFKNLKNLADDLARKELFFNNSKIELSMGMTSDYHIAIEEGATLIRIGTAIFGQRPPIKH